MAAARPIRRSSLSGGGLQESNNFCSVVGRSEAAKRLHVIAGHDRIGICNETIELVRVPDEARFLHRAGIAVARQRSGFPSDDLMQVGALAVLSLLHRVPRPASLR